MATKARQLKLGLRTWGARRKHAGRKPKGLTMRLARGMQGLTIRIAKALNRVMRRRGRVFADHYHSRVVRTPTEAARALEYVLRNFAHHAQRWGEDVPEDEADPFRSAACDGADPPPVCEPRTWLLSVGWRRAVAPVRARAA